jgi:hypothetical protein
MYKNRRAINRKKRICENSVAFSCQRLKSSGEIPCTPFGLLNLSLIRGIMLVWVQLIIKPSFKEIHRINGVKIVYLWKVDSLVEDFRAGKVTQREQFKYVMLSTIAIMIVSDPILYAGTVYNSYDTVGSLIMLIISVIGTYACYKINAGGDNQDFIQRLLCIGLPVGVRVIVAFIPILLVSFIVEGLFFDPGFVDEETFASTPMQVATMSALISAYYWYLSTKIRMVSSPACQSLS